MTAQEQLQAAMFIKEAYMVGPGGGAARALGGAIRDRFLSSGGPSMYDRIVGGVQDARNYARDFAYEHPTATKRIAAAGNALANPITGANITGPRLIGNAVKKMMNSVPAATKGIDAAGNAPTGPASVSVAGALKTTSK